MTYNEAEYNLRALQSVHNNAYNLLLYFGSAFAAQCYRTTLVVVIFYVLGRISHSPLSNFNYAALGLGVFMGGIAGMRRVTHQLCNYDDAVARLQKTLDEYKDLPR